MTEPSATTMSYAAALEAVVAEEMRDDPTVCMLGTIVPPALAAEFGPRARVTPISEPAVTGVAVGLAQTGKRPVVYWRNITFAFNAFDQIINHAAKLRSMSGEQVRVPAVFRAPCGGGHGLAAQHSQSPYSIYAHIAGLKVVVPSNPADAAGLLRAAIRDDDPVVCFEPVRLTETTGAVAPGHLVALGQADVKRAGADVTVLAVGSMVPLALEAADELERADVSVEVVDPRTVSPLDAETIRASVRRTGRLVVADEAPAPCSVAAEVVALVSEDRETFAALRAAPARVCALHVPVPFSEPLEQQVLPGREEIVSAIRALVR